MSDAADDAVIHKVMRRLIPFCIFCYLLNYIDRVNISVAKLTMVEDTTRHVGIPGFTESVYSFGASIFFLGYCLFELPSNLIMQRVGARRWIARIMISWGLLSAGFVFVRGAQSFYWLRFLLGTAEAGFFPGMIVYLSLWIPHRYRARASAAFLTSTAIAGVVGSLLSGLIGYAAKDNPLGLAPWQWIFLLEGLPTVILGAVTLWLLSDGPAEAKWLVPEERQRLGRIMAEERAAHGARHAADLKDAFKSVHTWVLSALYGLMIFSFYLINFYTPTILKESLKANGLVTQQTGGATVDLIVSLFSMIPFGLATVGMILIGRHSDQKNERKMHLAFACGLTTVGMCLAAGALSLHGWMGTAAMIAALSIAAVGTFGMFGPFWSLPPQLMTGTAASAAFAIINSIGNFNGGFVGPQIKEMMPRWMLFLLAAGLALVAMVMAFLAPIPKPGEIRGLEVVDTGMMDANDPGPKAGAKQG